MVKNGLKNNNIRGCVVIINTTGELNILCNPLNYIAAYEAGTAFSDITTILTFHTESTGEYQGFYTSWKVGT